MRVHCWPLAVIRLVPDLPERHEGSERRGQANGPLVRIVQAHADDAGLLRHELTHVGQWWRTAGLHGLLYLFSRRYRLASEAEAFAAQAGGDPAKVAKLSRALARWYDLGITEEEAARAIREAA